MSVRCAVIAGAIALGCFFLLLAFPASPLHRRLVSALASPSRPQPPRWPTPAPASSRPALRVAVGAMVSPERTFDAYRQIFAVLADHLDHRLELVQRPTYAETNALLDRGDVELAWVCSGAWPELERSGGARLLAVPVVNGQVTYQAYVVVGPSSMAARFADLAGARFAFTDPLSLTGYRYPASRVSQMRAGASEFFADTFFAHAHDNAIEAVRRGLADAASVDSLVFDYLARRLPESVAGLRIIERSAPYPIPPIVVGAQVPAAESELIAEVLLALHEEATGRELLASIGIDRFARPSPEAYRLLP